MKEIQDAPKPLEQVQEPKPLFQSRNALVTLASIVLSVFAAQNIEVGIDPNVLVEKLLTGNNIELLIVVAMNFANPIFKLIGKFRTKTFDWSFIRSMNFQTQVGSLISIAIGWKLGDVTTGLVIAIFMNAMNLVIHAFSKK